MNYKLSPQFKGEQMFKEQGFLGVPVHSFEAVGRNQLITFCS